MSGKRKDYTLVKSVLDDALSGFAVKVGPLKNEVRRRGSLIFNHKTEFPCLKQPENSPREAYYAILHMREYVRDQQQLRLPADLQRWRKDLANAPPEDIRQEFGRIQQKIAQLIHRDLCAKEGIFYYGPRAPSNDEIATLLELQKDDRPFNTLGGVRPLPARPSQKE